jgi:chromosome segregation ATPase
VSDDTLKLKQEIEKLTKKNQALKDSHHNRISSNRNDEEIKGLEQELQKAKETSDKYKDAYSEVIGKYKTAATKIKNLEQTVADDQLNLDKIKRECESVKGQMSTLQNRYKAANEEKVKIEKELSESKTR